MVMTLASTGTKSWSINAISEELGIDRRTVKKRIGDTPPFGTVNGYPVWKLKDVIFLVLGYGNLNNDLSIDIDKLPPRERRDWFESELKKTQLEKEHRQLIPAEEVETVVATAFSTIAQHIRSMPDNLERKLGISSELAEAIEIANDDYLEELAISLSKIATVEDV